MTREDLNEQIKQDFANEFGIPVDELGKDFLALSAVLTTYNYSMFLRINSIQNNVWPGSSDISTLLSVGFDKIGRLPFPAVSGIYTCSTTQTTGTTIIPAGNQFKKGEYIYESLADTTPGDPIQIRALEPGTESELAVSDTLTSVSPLESAGDTITVTSIDTSPSNAEDIDDYRQDVVNSFTLRPNGGNAADYILWASDVADIRTVFPYAKDGEAGKIKIYCEGVSQFQPDSAKIDEVIEAIKYDTEGVGRVLVDLFPFINDTNIVPVQITNVLLTLNGGDSGQQTLAEQIIKDYLYNKRPYLATLNKVRVSTQDTITVVEIISVLANNGIQFTDIVLAVKILGSPTITPVTSYQFGNPNDPLYYGEIPELETLTINV